MNNMLREIQIIWNNETKCYMQRDLKVPESLNTHGYKVNLQKSFIVFEIAKDEEKEMLLARNNLISRMEEMVFNKIKDLRYMYNELKDGNTLLIK